MDAVRTRLPLWAAALWWGSLSTLGFLVVPLLFLHLPSPAMAGAMAARLFTAQTWLSVVCTLLLLLASRPRGDAEGPSALHGARLFIVGGLLLALLVELVIAPRIVARENLALWHRLGTGMYVVQWMCAAATLWSLSRKT